MHKQIKNNIVSLSKIIEKNEILERDLRKFLHLTKKDKFEKLRNGLFFVEKDKKQYIIKIYETTDYKTNNKSSLRIQSSNSYFEFIEKSIKNNQIPICLGCIYKNDNVIFYNMPLNEMLKTKGTHSKSYPIRKTFLSHIIENKDNYKNNFYYYKDENKIVKYRYTCNSKLILETSEKETRIYLKKNIELTNETILSKLFKLELLMQLCQKLMQETHNINTLKENSKTIKFIGRDVENITNELFKYKEYNVLDYANKDLSFDSLIDNIAISIKTILSTNSYIKIYEMTKIIKEVENLKSLSSLEQAILISKIFNERRKNEEETYLIKDWEYIIYKRYKDKVEILNDKIYNIDVDTIKIKSNTKTRLVFCDKNITYFYSYSNNTLSLYHKNIPTLTTIELENEQYENVFFENIIKEFEKKELLNNKKVN